MYVNVVLIQCNISSNRSLLLAQRPTSRAGPIAGVIIGPTGLGAPGSSITRGYKIKLNTTIIRRHSHINALAILVEGLSHHYKFQGINHKLLLLSRHSSLEVALMKTSM